MFLIILDFSKKMNKKIKILSFGIIILNVFVGCVTEYIHKSLNNIGNILVVQGTISDNETTIKLSRSIGLEETAVNDLIAINDADVNIECDDGTVFDIQSIKEGKYLFFTGELDKDKSYRLNIFYEGNHYQSSYSHPLYTPEIDSLYYKKEGLGEPVGIYLSTHNINDEISYYQWSYMEEWEYSTTFIATVTEYFFEGKFHQIYYDIATPNNIYYCWSKGEAPRLILASTNKFSSNTILDQKIIESSPESNRWSSVYRIKVKQNTLSREGYEYFSNLQKNVEESGSLFAPIPSEMKGNITCINNPNIHVIGYVNVSTISIKEMYIYASDNLYEYPKYECETTRDAYVAYEKGLLLFHIEKTPERDVRYYAPVNCFDCRRNGGSKVRPENWPTNNY